MSKSSVGVLLASVFFFVMGASAESLKKLSDGSSATCSTPRAELGEILVKMEATPEGAVVVRLVACGTQRGGDVSSVSYTIGSRTVVSSFSDFQLLILNPAKEVKAVLKLKNIATSSEEVIVPESSLAEGDEVFVQAHRKLSVDGVESDSGLVSWGSYILLP